MSQEPREKRKEKKEMKDLFIIIFFYVNLIDKLIKVIDVHLIRNSIISKRLKLLYSHLKVFND